MVALWRSNPPSTLEELVRDGSMRYAGVVSHIDHVANLVDAIAVLESQQMLVQCAPLIRTLMESAVTAAWFAATPGSWDAASLDGIRQRLKLARDVDSEQGIPTSPETEDLEQGEKDLVEFFSTEAETFLGRVQSLQGMGTVYVGYRVLSGYTHAGTPLMDHYLRQDDSAKFGLQYSADFEFADADKCFWSIPPMVHLAVSAWDSIDPDARYRSELEAITRLTSINSPVTRRKTERQQRAERLADRNAKGDAARARREAAS